MGDTSQDGGLGQNGFFSQQSAQDPYHLSFAKHDNQFHPSLGSRQSSGQTPFYSQFSNLPSIPQRMDNSRYQQSAAGGNPNQPTSNFNMSSMSGALPEYGAQQQQGSQQHLPNQRRLSGASTPAVVYQMQQNLQYPHQQGASYSGQIGQSQYGQTPYSNYGQNQAAQGSGYSHLQQQQRGGHGMPQQYSGYSPMSPQYYYYPGANQGYSPMPYAPASSLQPSITGRGISGASAEGHSPDPQGAELYGGIRRQGSNNSLSSVPRGPPRKPKQSGHALWVGNLPPGATIVDLKDHFSREATKDIESLFLISKSNCAFVNYRTEAACQAAMQRFHDSRFHGVRLVCRLRRSSAPTSGVPTEPAAMSGRRTSTASSTRSPLLDGTADALRDASRATDSAVDGEPAPGVKVDEKFFVVKSLTLQDLEQSVRNGIWATQSHNEQVLNKAFESADNVYLIFSANKSGEYFGYARMTSPIKEDAAEIMRTVPASDSTPREATDAPKTIPTPATDWAPKGRIIDDSARGTIFWEAEQSDDEEEGLTSQPLAVDGEEPDVSAGGTPQVWGKPFKIEWISTNRLPFYRTRGLRNPWNANREVKIARDGTELETSVGKRLVQMFHRPGPPSNAQMQQQHMSQMMHGQHMLPHMGGSGAGGPGMPY